MIFSHKLTSAQLIDTAEATLVYIGRSEAIGLRQPARVNFLES